MKSLIINAKIYIESGVFAEAVFIKDGKIIATGTSKAMDELAGDDCKVIDACGNTVLPGLNDSHMHLELIGESLFQAPITNARSVDDVVNICRKFILEHPERVKNGLMAMGWNQDLFNDEKRFLNRHDLDRISTEIPILLQRVCGHIATANTKAIEIADLKTADQFEGGEVGIGEDGYPNGFLAENAVGGTCFIFPDPTVEKYREITKIAAEYAVSVGLTSVQSNDVRDDNMHFMFDVIHKLVESRNMPLRYRHQVCLVEEKNLQSYIKGEFVNGKYSGDRLTLGPLKLFKDGSLGARTATMRHDYLDDPGNRGINVLSNELCDKLCKLASDNNMQLITHAIGDDAIERVLDSYAKVSDAKNKLRNSLVHCQITDMPLLKRIADNNILTQVQPIFLDYDMQVVESRVGKALASFSYAFKTLIDLGAHVAYGSDAPVEDCNPFPCIYLAVTRKSLSGQPEGGFYPNECVTVEQAIDAYTVESAYAEFAEDKKGRIKKGQYADIIIIDRDIFTVEKDKIKDIKVLLTMVDGEIVYQKESFSTHKS